MAPSHLELAVGMAELFEEIGVRYVVGGSVASSLIGEPRSTVDIDIAVRLTAKDLDILVDRVRPTFYVPESDAARAVREKDSFNIIHNEGALKIDLFVLGDGLLDVNQINRRVLIEVPTQPLAELWITSPEDQVLRKLDWYRQGGESSDRQMRDIIAILTINSDRLDNTYLTDTAALVGLTELLNTARQGAT
ncbi:MAG TPA: hypothetical protein DCY82_08730 [Acidimicrobiaceae bacterium]|nr:hypothetical protein [Acidimicrobiaceae bacterium]